ncbi:twin-arginine translocase TatA/TatE family subunit [Sphingoaurantiacus capsulatus]|uniref:Sec-independent protein translocase protein TatA n=1 Tax=Sphingoaurantiacus capsulatus TaxID=1771310 RepID=A0ABV7XC86_9SPHN
MGSFSIWHWLVVGVIVLLLFGKGRISDIMGETAKGIKAFKKGMTEDDAPPPAPAPAPRQVTTAPPAETAAPAREEANRP